MHLAKPNGAHTAVNKQSNFHRIIKINLKILMCNRWTHWNDQSKKGAGKRLINI